MWDRYKRKIFIVAGILLSAYAVLYFVRVPITLALLERGLTNRMTQGAFYKALPDGLHLVLCGAGAPLPDAERSGPCIGVVAGESYFVFDAGTNGARNLMRMGWNAGLLDAVFLTHYHSDHIDGLGELALFRWTGGAHEAPLAVYGAKGIKKIIDGFNLAYAQDFIYRVKHHGRAVVEPKAAGMTAKEFALPALGQKTLVWDKSGVKIYAFRVEHDPVSPASGYRIEYKGRVITISGDSKKSSAVEKFARGADLLAHEALSPKLVGIITKAAAVAGNKRLEKITKDILDYHTTPIEAAEIAKAAQVKHLLFYHIVPPLPLSPLEDVFLEGVRDVWHGGLTLGKDGILISLPAHDKEAIIIDKLL